MKILLYVVSSVLILPAGGYLAANSLGKSLSHQAKSTQIDGLGSFVVYVVVGLFKIILMLTSSVFGAIYVAIFGENIQLAGTMTVVGFVLLFAAMFIRSGHNEHH